MKQVNSIIGKTLLFVMMVFIMHDYVIGQQDLTPKMITSESLSIQNSCGCATVVEHHLFHTPFLFTSNSVDIYDLSLVAPEFFLKMLLSQNFPILPFNPPKFS
jgi:hypothetical protein